jgi:hypothetical protein
MGVLGILTCEILELEFAHLLREDPDVVRVTVLQDSKSDRFIKYIEKSNKIKRFEKIHHVKDYNPDPECRFEVLIQVLELALHNRKKVLQQGLLEAAKGVSHTVDALFLGYGLCGNALEDPHGLLAGADVPIFLPCDDGHPVDDCVGLLLGGREQYYAEQCKIAGTFFMTPGWTHHWKRIFDQDYGNLSVDLAKRLFRHYERSLLIATPIMTREEMRQNVEDFNHLFGFRAETMEGTLHLLDETWQIAKDFVLERSHCRARESCL